MDESYYQRRLWQCNVVSVASLQLPLHAYSIVALRLSNGNLLSDDDDKYNWGFGQIIALIILGITLVEVFRGGKTLIQTIRNLALGRWPTKKTTVAWNVVLEALES